MPGPGFMNLPQLGVSSLKKTGTFSLVLMRKSVGTLSLEWSGLRSATRECVYTWPTVENSLKLIPLFFIPACEFCPAFSLGG